MNIEHPDITAAQLYGYPKKPLDMPECPICGKQCDEIYLNIYGEVVGCDVCIKVKDSFEWMEGCL